LNLEKAKDIRRFRHNACDECGQLGNSRARCAPRPATGSRSANRLTSAAVQLPVHGRLAATRAESNTLQVGSAVALPSELQTTLFVRFGRAVDLSLNKGKDVLAATRKHGETSSKEHRVHVHKSVQKNFENFAKPANHVGTCPNKYAKILNDVKDNSERQLNSNTKKAAIYS